MAALFKYFVGVAVILPAVMVGIVLFAVNMGEIFVSFAAVVQAPATETARWNVERLKANPDTPYVARGSLSPIYPATPGKELLGKPVNTAIRVPNKFRKPASAKRIDVRQALQLHKLPRQIYAAGEQERNYPQQSLSYAKMRPSQPRVLIVLGHGIY
jgi:hypothetical protein